MFLDMLRYGRWSHDGRLDRLPLQRESALLKHYHGIEKGLALAAPRPGFGREKIQGLLERLASYRDDSEIAAAARDSILAYYTFNRDNGEDVSWLEDWAGPCDKLPQEGSGGTRRRTREEILAAVAGVDAQFFETRHSIRQFAPGKVSLDDVRRAVAMAGRSPSVCNRQGARVHCFTKPMDALRWQSGNAGFGDKAALALVVTADLQAFSSVGERYQAYVDGGLFAMSLVHAFHSLGYGTCMLAWSQERSRNLKAKAALAIPESETMILMIAVGLLPDEFVVAQAWRRPVSDILRII